MIPPDSVVLTPGTRIGHYEIVSSLGTGGMGAVFRARDTRPEMARDVAIKVAQTAEFDPEARRRFEHEARATSALNHPNVIAIYDVGLHAGLPYLVEELIDGRTLRDVLNVGPLPARKTIEYGRAIAEGLAAAHGRGLVHRDLKPENVMITADGRVKILDFGLARQTAPVVASAATTTGHGTAPGTVLGTVAYMSPEQARGLTTDHRSDIFSLGVVLFELATGHRPFGGATASDTLAAILRAEPAEVPAGRVSQAVERVIRRCLEKEPDRRFQSASDLAFALEFASTASGSTPGAPDEAPGSRQVAPSRLTRWAPWAAAVAFAALATVAVLTRPQTTSAPAPRMQSSIAIAEPYRLGRGLAQEPHIWSALSPDAKRLAYVGEDAEGGRRIHVQHLADGRFEVLNGTDGAYFPFWSPDGTKIGFFADDRLKFLPAVGGPVTVVCSAPNAYGGSWGTDGVLFSLNTEGIFHVDPAGGAPSAVTRVLADQGEAAHQWPSHLPDGRGFIYTVARPDAWEIRLGGPSADPPKTLVTDATFAAVTSSSLLYVRQGRLMAQTLDLSSRQVIGEATAVGGSEGSPASMATASGNLLVYSSSRALSGGRTVFKALDRRGGIVATYMQGGLSPQVSPDGQMFAYFRTTIGTSTTGTDVWITSLGNGDTRREVHGPGNQVFPVWHPNGTRLAYGESALGNSAVREHDVARPSADRIVTSQQDVGVIALPRSWSHDGAWLLLSLNRPGRTDSDLLALDVLRGTLQSLAATQSHERSGVFWPGGSWIAFSADDTGRPEVYVQPAAPEAPRRQVSTTGGRWPRWRHDGRELFYIDREGWLVARSITGTTQPEVGPQTRLFRIPVSTLITEAYDVSPDGQRFIVDVAADTAAPLPLTLIQNWR